MTIKYLKCVFADKLYLTAVCVFKMSLQYLTQWDFLLLNLNLFIDCTANIVNNSCHLKNI